jgi:hypothetical protein
MSTINFVYPNIPLPSNGSLPAVTAGILDATTDLQGQVYRAEDAVTITKVAVRFTAVGGTSTDRVIRAGIVYIDATTGYPASTPVWADATFSGAAGTAYAEITAVPATPVPAINVFTEFTLTTAVTMAKGTYFGIVVKGMTGTWSATDSVSVTRGWNTITPYIRFPYGFEITTGSTLARVNSACPGTYYSTSTTTYGYPMETFSTLGINNGTAPAEAGMTFRIPSTVCSTYKVAGLVLSAQLGTGGFDVVLYSGLTALQTTSWDGDITHVGNQSQCNLRFDTATLSTLNSGTDYTITIKPTSATNFGTFSYMTFNNTAHKQVFISTPTDIVYVSRNTGGGAFTSNTTRLFCMQLMIEDMAFTSSSSGGLVVHPGMSGGMRS